MHSRDDGSSSVDTGAPRWIVGHCQGLTGALAIIPPTSGFAHTSGFFLSGAPPVSADRAILFVDGSNFYNGLGEIGVGNRFNLNYARIAEKLLGPRDFVGLRFYVGRVRGHRELARKQNGFLDRLRATDPRISIHLGRIARRQNENPLAEELLHYLGALRIPMATTIYTTLVRMARRHRNVPIYVEKGVDVMIAIDMVGMAIQSSYDAAYLLSADGDFAPAAQFVRDLGKKVFAASPRPGAALAKAVDTFIPLPKPWFRDCY